jgi:hypothetical protein
MNIKEAKAEVKRTIKAYLSKDKYGRYIIPQHKQRPVFLLGAPGIGKTEIMSQIASELNIPMLSYSMTHHTRQSAIGLPIIKKKIYGGKEYDISEYTMSEIIASVYNMIEATGKDTGILFLDEINCVSETLSPIILQFLQYKVFGGHKVPDGWIVVTAGNPPEYNNSVHEFDIVTWDRLKRIEVEPDFEVWKEYAYEVGVHPSIITYLETKKKNFYHIEQNVDGKSFVTARGWDDLSRIIQVYEAAGEPVDKNLIGQYIHNEKIARDFGVYYDLYKKYKSDYHVGDIVSGAYDQELIDRSANAEYDEKFSLLGLLIEVLGDDAKSVINNENVMTENFSKLKELKESKTVEETLEKYISELEEEISRKKNSNALSDKDYGILLIRIDLLKKYEKAAKLLPDAPFEAVRLAFNKDAADHKKMCETVKKHYSNAFKFCDAAFGSDSQQLLILCTEMVANTHISLYIATKGCDEYYKHDELLMFHKRNIEIIKELETLNEIEEM